MIAAQSQTTPAPGSSDVTALPHDIRKCLRDFRRRVWIIKAAEGLFVGLFGLVFHHFPTTLQPDSFLA